MRAILQAKSLAGYCDGGYRHPDSTPRDFAMLRRFRPSAEVRGTCYVDGVPLMSLVQDRLAGLECDDSGRSMTAFDAPGRVKIRTARMNST
jgi:hypothetical protein